MRQKDLAFFSAKRSKDTNANSKKRNDDHRAFLETRQHRKPIAHCSRSKAKEMLKAQYVKVNDIVLDENTQLCDNDFVSIRKVGRFQYKGIDAKTKKDRLVLRFEQYI